MSGRVNRSRFDPYKNFKFRVKTDGSYVAGVKKAIPKSPPDAAGFTPYKLRQLREVVSQAKKLSESRAKSKRGTTALFIGAQGTGRTLAAQVIAAGLGADLYRVDLAALSSKYIGETEKNLDRVFEAAEKAGAILFFDEADAIFGQRTDVRDSHDRYANMDARDLLRRLESYSGISILTTTRKQNIDTAFLRRLKYVINFKA